MDILKYFVDKKAREKLTQKHFADKAGITASDLYAICQGNVVAKMSTAKKLEMATNGDLPAERIIEYGMKKKLKKIQELCHKRDEESSAA